jgi:uncharacterized membrane protein
MSERNYHTDNNEDKESKMNTKNPLIFFVGMMVGMVLLALVFPNKLEELLDRPALYQHVLFVHVVAVNLFFGNAVIGILWELRALASERADAILHTYNTVTWLDARFSSPMIVISLIAGIMLSIILGDMWQIGWLSVSFLLFVFSGLVWVVSDIPTQYKIKKLIAEVESGAQAVPEELMRLLKMRLWVSIAGVLPLVGVFALMVYKPQIVPVAQWFV